MTQVRDLFEIWTGHGIDLIRLERCDPTAPQSVAYVSRSERNNGITAYVICPSDVTPAEAGTLSVSVGGSICSTFVQPRPYICAQNVRVLTPRKDMELREKLWWARCIRQNRYRFNYGRHANRTLAYLDLPDAPPDWLTDVSGSTLARLKDAVQTVGADFAASQASPALDSDLTVADLFEVSYGQSLTLSHLCQDPGGIPFVSRRRRNNGIAARVKPVPGVEPSPGGCLSVALGGSVLTTSVQHELFYTAYHVAVLKPRVAMSLREKLWWAMCIEANRYRYNYGRQANRTLARLRFPSEVPPWVTVGDLSIADDMSKRLAGDLRELGF